MICSKYLWLYFIMNENQLNRHPVLVIWQSFALIYWLTETCLIRLLTSERSSIYRGLLDHIFLKLHKQGEPTSDFFQFSACLIGLPNYNPVQQHTNREWIQLRQCRSVSNGANDVAWNPVRCSILEWNSVGQQSFHPSNYHAERNATTYCPVPLSTVLPPKMSECHSGPGSQQVWGFSCRYSGSGWNKLPQIWRWSAQSVLGNIRKPPARAPPGCFARRSYACAWTRWRSLCRSLAWWLMHPYSKWRTPRPCWYEKQKKKKIKFTNQARDSVSLCFYEEKWRALV